MATPAEFGGLAALYLPGVPRSLTAIHGGLQYTGEVVLLDQWDPEWGRSLEGDVYFRVVLLRSRRQLPRGAVYDSRIAACVPGRRSPRGRSEVGRELTAIRETQATYRTLRDPQDSPVRGYLERQREELEGRLLAEEASLYASGYVESPTGFSKDLGGYFAGPEPTRWFQGLAETLLSWAYPSLPLDSALLPRLLESQEIPRIYEALFARSASERAALGEFGPGLGLSKPEAPLEFDPGACRVFQEVRASLESRGGELPWEGVRSLLAHAVGLIRPLATLYLLAFVHYGRPETELSLVQGHGLTLRGGRPVRGARLSREFLPSLTWPAEPGDQDARFDQSFNSIRLLGEELSWNDALQYTSLLCQGLAEVEQDLEVAGQERELLGALQELSGDADQALATLARLGEAAAGPSGRDLHSSLQRLQGVCEGRDFRQVHLVARTTYGDPRELLEDLDLLRRLLHLGESLERIVGMKTYLDDGAVVARNEQLSVDRMALMEEMSLGALLASSQGWPTLRARFQDYQQRYRRAYLHHHEGYQSMAARAWESLEDSLLKLNALALLNSIGELGEPVGRELVARHIQLEQVIRRCDMGPSESPLDASPRCPTCRMALGDAVPARELGNFVRDLDRALGKQNRRLSRMLVERILHHRADPRLGDFLRIVQASDLSALSNTLDYELAQFIRQLLQNP